MKTIFVNAVKAQVGQAEIVLDLGSFFPEGKPGEPPPAVPPPGHEYDIRVVMPLSVAEQVAKSLLKGIEMARGQPPASIAARASR